MFFERAEIGNRAIIVHIEFPKSDDREDPDEFRELVTSAGGVIAGSITGTRKSVQPKFYVGSGKLDEILSIARSLRRLSR